MGNIEDYIIVSSEVLNPKYSKPFKIGGVMTLLNIYLWTVAGVLISFILPPLLRAAGVTTKHDPTASVAAFLPRVKMLFTNRYVAVTILSLVVSLIVVALLQDKLNSWNMALISGLGWQSILARIIAPGT